MRFCRDCTVSLSLKGLGTRRGSVSIPLVKNDGEPVVLTATASQPDAKDDKILFIGEQNGNEFEFKFPGGQGPVRVPSSNIDAFSRFDVTIEIVFDPAADENVIRVIDRKISVFAREVNGDEGCIPEICYVECEGEFICGEAPFDYNCNGVLVSCDIPQLP